MSEALKPCPFCGKKGTFYLKLEEDVYGNSFIRCRWCGAGGRLSSGVPGVRSRKDAIAAWNRRKEAEK